MDIAVLGIDLGKNSCGIVGLDAVGAVVLRRRMRRQGVIKLTGKLRRCVVGDGGRFGIGENGGPGPAT